MDVLVALGAWTGGSVVVSLAVGTAIARADRRVRLGGAVGARTTPPATPQVLALLPRQRSAATSDVRRADPLTRTT